jgi:cytochrome c
MKKIGIVMAAGSAYAAGDVKKGKRVFNKCKACHSLEAGKKKIGPSLHGVFGRTSGTAAKFKFSSAMKKAKIVWNAETMDKYIEKPRKLVPGTRMAFPGLKKKADRDNLIAYLMEATKAN